MRIFHLFRKAKQALIPLAAVSLFNDAQAEDDWSRNTQVIVSSIKKISKLPTEEILPEYNKQMLEFLDSFGKDLINSISKKEYAKSRRQLNFLIKLQKIYRNKKVNKKIDKLLASIQLAIKNAKKT